MLLKPLRLTAGSRSKTLVGAKWRASTYLNAALLGRQRIDLILDDYAQQNPALKSEELAQLQKKFARLWADPSLCAYSQRLRRLREAYKDEPIISKRLNSLQNKRFLCTDYLKFPQASSFLAPLDRSMRFLDEKLQTEGQFRAEKNVFLYGEVERCKPF